MKRRLLNKMAFLAAATPWTLWAQAQSSRPISLIVGYSAGGSADLVARIVGAELAKHLGRTVIIENVVGASGMLAAQKVLTRRLTAT